MRKSSWPAPVRGARHARDVPGREAGRGTALPGERCRSVAAGEHERGRRGGAGARRGHPARAPWAAQRARGAAHLAGARHRHLRAQQPLASRGGGRERRAAARPHDGPALMGAPASTLGGLLRAAFDALRTRLDLAAVELEIHLLSLVRVLVWLMAAVACALLAVAFAVTALVVALWDTHRTLGLLGGTLAFLALAGVCAALGARTLRRQPGVLEGCCRSSSSLAPPGSLRCGPCRCCACSATAMHRAPPAPPQPHPPRPRKAARATPSAAWRRRSLAGSQRDVCEPAAACDAGAGGVSGSAASPTRVGMPLAATSVARARSQLMAAVLLPSAWSSICDSNCTSGSMLCPSSSTGGCASSNS